MMKRPIILALSVFILAGCTSQKNLSYLNNLPETGGESYFTMDVPYYKVQPRDIFYVSVKTQTQDGGLTDILTGQNPSVSNQVQGEASQYVAGYSVDPEGMLTLPLFGKTPVNGKTIYEVRDLIQAKADSLFRHAYVEVRLLSYKFTVIGEVKVPGSYFNYSDQLTVFEALGRAGGVSDFGSRKNVLVVRPTGKQTVTYKLDLQDKKILESPAYFISPNDVIIVQETGRKVFNLNLPVYSIIISSVTGVITTTVLLINFLK
jgi:polysaccharide biosynthesis/export protein